MKLVALGLAGLIFVEACSGSVMRQPTPRNGALDESAEAKAAVQRDREEQPRSQLLPWLVFVGSAAATVVALFAIVSTHTFEGHG